MLKDGVIARLEAINLAVNPEAAQEFGVRSVPWLRIGQFELEGALTPGELRRWADAHDSTAGVKDYFFQMLKSGRRDKVERLIRSKPEFSAVFAELMRDPETSMAVRLGIAAVLEELRGTSLTDALVAPLGELTHHEDALTRADACHFLTLIGGEEVIPYLRACLDDEDSEVREIAQEALGIEL